MADLIVGQMVVTFTVLNTLPPAIVPNVETSSTVTDTLQVLNTFDYTKDPNTVRAVLLTDALLNGTTFISSTPTVQTNSGELAWNLGDIPPLSRASITMTLNIPGNLPDFAALDRSATVWGSLASRQVSAQAGALIVAPTTYGNWLKRTIDADTSDQYMLAALGSVGQSAETIFTYVRALGYEAYRGSLRGARGTVWSEAGNSLDKTNLLIAMLRASGIPARYRHGQLDTTNTQRLILSMFPANTSGIGRISDELPVSDPANDAALQTEVQDHWWAEVFVPGQGWRDADPSFANATIGQSFVAAPATDGTDRVAEVPDAVRHKIGVQLKLERYNVLEQLSYSYPISAVLNSVEMVGNPLTLQHLVNSTGQGGFIFTVQTTDYMPFLVIGDRSIDGTKFQDFVSNFAGPLVNTIHTAEWLVFTLISPLGQTQVFTREVVDRIGVAARQPGGNTQFTAGSGQKPLLQETDVFQVTFGPSEVPAAARNAQAKAMVDISNTLRDVLARIDALPPGTPQTVNPVARDALATYRKWASGFLHSINLTHYVDSDDGADQLAERLLVKAYPNRPRIIISGISLSDAGVLRTTLDLLNDQITAHAYPGQDAGMSETYRSMRGYVESYLEGNTLERVTGITARTTANVFAAYNANEADPEVIVVTADDLSQLETSTLSVQARSRIVSAVRSGKVVVAPKHMVTLNGEQTVGWWEKDPITGDVSGVMEDGLHFAAVEYAFPAQLEPGRLGSRGFLAWCGGIQLESGCETLGRSQFRGAI